MTVGPSFEPQGIWGIVLAGAYPKGRSLFDRLRPRPLLPVAERPIISYSLRWLSDAGVSGVTVCLNGASREVRRAVEAETGIDCPVVFREDPEPRGTAGAARDAACATDAGTFLVVNGTAIPTVDPREILDFHRGSGATVTVLARGEAANVSVGSELSPAGVYVFDRRAFADVAEQGFQDIKETLLTKLHRAGERVVTYPTAAAGARVVSTETYLAANESLIPRSVEGQAPPGYERHGQALVHFSARVSGSARLVGPVIIGPDASIDADATVVGPSAVGTGCHVGAAAVVSRSVLWDQCLVGAGSLLDRCLISDGGLVPAGSRLYGALRAGPVSRPERGFRWARLLEGRPAAAVASGSFARPGAAQGSSLATHLR